MYPKDQLTLYFYFYLHVKSHMMNSPVLVSESWSCSVCCCSRAAPPCSAAIRCREGRHRHHRRRRHRHPDPRLVAISVSACWRASADSPSSWLHSLFALRVPFSPSSRLCSRPVCSAVCCLCLLLFLFLLFTFIFLFLLSSSSPSQSSFLLLLLQFFILHLSSSFCPVLSFVGTSRSVLIALIRNLKFVSLLVIVGAKSAGDGNVGWKPIGLLWWDKKIK